MRLPTLTWDVCLNWNARSASEREFGRSSALLQRGSAGKPLVKFWSFVSDGYAFWVLPCMSGWEGNGASNQLGVRKGLDARPPVRFSDLKELANAETLQVKREKETLRFYD